MKSYENVMTTDGLDALARDVNEWARGKGFWENPIQVSDLKEDERLTQLTKTQKGAAGRDGASRADRRHSQA
jgi:hypothetical protein